MQGKPGCWPLWSSPLQGQVLNPAQFKCQLDAGSPVWAAADPPQGMVLPGFTHPFG